MSAVSLYCLGSTSLKRYATGFAFVAETIRRKDFPIRWVEFGTSRVFFCRDLAFALFGQEFFANVVHHFFEAAWPLAVYNAYLLRNLKTNAGTHFRANSAAEMFKCFAALMPILAGLAIEEV